MTVTSFIKTGTFVLRKEFMSDRSHTSMSGPLGSDLRTLYPTEVLLNRNVTKVAVILTHIGNFILEKLGLSAEPRISGGKCDYLLQLARFFFFFLLFEVSRKGSIAGG